MVTLTAAACNLVQLLKLVGATAEQHKESVHNLPGTMMFTVMAIKNSQSDRSPHPDQPVVNPFQNSLSAKIPKFNPSGHKTLLISPPAAIAILITH